MHGGDIYTHKCVNDFSANINPHGLPNGVKQAIVDNIDSFSSYPDPMQRELKSLLAEPGEHVAVGNGAADIIYRIATALSPRKALIISPTFSEYSRALHCEVSHHFLLEQHNFRLNADCLARIKGVDIVFICNPNNPTGNKVDADLMQYIASTCQQNGAILVVDECFMDFCGEHLPLINENIIVLRAFTKLYAMAGIRLGYAVSKNADIISKIDNVGQPWAVSCVATVCGAAALKEVEYVKRTLAVNAENRAYLSSELANLGFKVYPSFANFILFKSDDIYLKEKLLQRNILLRSCNNFLGLGSGFYRVAVKLRPDCELLITELSALHT